MTLNKMFAALLVTTLALAIVPIANASFPAGEARCAQCPNPCQDSTCCNGAPCTPPPPCYPRSGDTGKVRGQVTWSEAAVQANCYDGQNTYTGVAYAHLAGVYTDQAHWTQGANVYEKDYDSGCYQCVGAPWSETQDWQASCYDCTDGAKVKDSDAIVHL